MHLRLQRIDQTANTWRWYVLSVQRTLFGEWAVIREWGRIGNAGGQRQASYFDTLPEALAACDAFRARKAKRRYAAAPEYSNVMSNPDEVGCEQKRCPRPAPQGV